MLESVKYRITL